MGLLRGFYFELSDLMRHEGWFHFASRQSLPIKPLEPTVRLHLLNELESRTHLLFR